MAKLEDQSTEPLTINKVILRSSDNYKDWLGAVTNRLILKDVYDVASGLEDYPKPVFEQKKWIKKDRQAWAIINGLLDRSIHNVLPSELAIVSSNVTFETIQGESGVQTIALSQSGLLLEHLKANYSAARGSRRVELFRLIWRTNIQEDEDPLPVISGMREAYNDLASSTKTVFADNDLATAILLSLPPSYSTIVQGLSMRDSITSADVISTVGDEYRRRTAQETEQALLTQTKTKVSSRKQLDGSKKEKKWCAHHNSKSHNTSECIALKALESRAPTSQQTSANLAQQNRDSIHSSSDMNILYAETPSHTSSFFAVAPASALHATPVASLSSLVIDSGCGTSMVMERSLLHDIVTLPSAVPLRVGNSQTVSAR
ncbi:hypothetical protein M231_01176 [Tremella mesenterica]|uniref:Retrotransposon Copia-like N-terminal domain-containing protein n=1 Tax=Tremella mesenterica TaxID=5217 RepID=A0A4Q1BTY0_TREME|nr:hypothetical protein M231_01176 [Tremella mesenterica]